MFSIFKNFNFQKRLISKNSSKKYYPILEIIQNVIRYSNTSKIIVMLKSNSSSFLIASSSLMYLFFSSLDSVDDFSDSSKYMFSDQYFMRECEALARQI